jgi:thiol-disulfide isomerase/thioredoxin
MPAFRIVLAACAMLLAWAVAAAAEGIPPAYDPVVILPAGEPAKTEFDLTAVAARAKRENRRLYVYLGAKDCAYCRKYEAFLEQNSKALVPQFAAHNYIVVDLRSALSVTQDRLFIRVGDTSRSYVDFQKSIGDVRARMLVYPLVWLFDGNLKPLMQMPAGTGTFQTVPEQLEILQLVE